MDACRECSAYKVHHDQAEPWECPDCGQKTFIWKQHSCGQFYLECSNCGAFAAVDRNTPCEQDLIFWQKTEVIVKPQGKKYSNRAILDLANYFHINALQMREKLIQGFTVELSLEKLDEYAELFEQYGVEYSIVEPEDPRRKYHYYKKCNYPYSSMQIYLK